MGLYEVENEKKGRILLVTIIGIIVPSTAQTLLDGPKSLNMLFLTTVKASLIPKLHFMYHRAPGDELSLY